MDFKETLLHAILEADLNPNLAVVQMVINAGVGVNAWTLMGFRLSGGLLPMIMKVP